VPVHAVAFHAFQVKRVLPPLRTVDGVAAIVTSGASSGSADAVYTAANARAIAATRHNAKRGLRPIKRAGSKIQIELAALRQVSVFY
jgi:hypothetical protein